MTVCAIKKLIDVLGTREDVAPISAIQHCLEFQCSLCFRSIIERLFEKDSGRRTSRRSSAQTLARQNLFRSHLPQSGAVKGELQRLDSFCYFSTCFVNPIRMDRKACGWKQVYDVRPPTRWELSCKVRYHGTTFFVSPQYWIRPPNLLMIEYLLAA